MRRFWPSSLLGQILLAAALALLAVQLINAAVRVQTIQKRLAAETSWMVSSITSRHLERERNGKAAQIPPVVRLMRSNHSVKPAGFQYDDELAAMVSEHLQSQSPQIELVRLSIGPMHSLPAALRPRIFIEEIVGLMALAQATEQNRLFC